MPVHAIYLNERGTEFVGQRFPALRTYLEWVRDQRPDLTHIELGTPAALLTADGEILPLEAGLARVPAGDLDSAGKYAYQRWGVFIYLDAHTPDGGLVAYPPPEEALCYTLYNQAGLDKRTADKAVAAALQAQLDTLPGRWFICRFAQSELPAWEGQSLRLREVLGGDYATADAAERAARQTERKLQRAGEWGSVLVARKAADRAAAARGEFLDEA